MLATSNTNTLKLLVTMKRNYLLLFALLFSIGQLYAKNYLISTPNTSLLITAQENEKAKFQYYGSRIQEADIPTVFDSGLAFDVESYPVFGLQTAGERAMVVAHADGNMSLDLVVSKVSQYDDAEGSITEILMKDQIYPFYLKQFFKTYKGTDILSTWVQVENRGKKEIILYKFASAFFPVSRGDNWLTHFHGFWGAESTMDEEKLTSGQKVITNKDGLVNTESDNPSFLLSMDGRPQEEHGDVLGGTLAWTGNYTLKMDVKNTQFNVIAGINEDASHYVLEPGGVFETPEFAMTYSTTGKGGVSRAFHRWARNYKLHNGHLVHDILLNSWEGVYFNINQDEMDEMMRLFSELGGELFVMDDGWFGNKYPRNNSTSSLGDWEVCKEKLPLGVEGLLDSAKKYGIKFGLWIEPEMANTKSELFEKHPDWILHIKDRPLSTGRGGTQVVLDLTNPKVQDFVFGVVDNLMSQHPEIAYMKWDDNSSLMDYGSTYLPKNRQSHLYIEYQRGLNTVLKRIRSKYPDLVLQACAGGGGRVNYGILPYFNEFWTSDNTDALQRVYLQWSISSFYPSVAMASHVSADKNHQTGRITPLKFRFDVAMSGRLGMEMQPKDMTETDKEFARRAIGAYKDVRSIVQFGDLYRLVSPYDRKGISSLMYITENKKEAVFFTYKIEHLVNMLIPNVKMNGLDPNKNYKIIDLTPTAVDKPCALDGKVMSGKFLMDEGLSMKSLLKNNYSSLALKLEEL